MKTIILQLTIFIFLSSCQSREFKINQIKKFDKTVSENANLKNVVALNYDFDEQVNVIISHSPSYNGAIVYQDNDIERSFYLDFSNCSFVLLDAIDFKYLKSINLDLLKLILEEKTDEDFISEGTSFKLLVFKKSNIIYDKSNVTYSMNDRLTKKFKLMKLWKFFYKKSKVMFQ
jgi:hypothetical protein